MSKFWKIAILICLGDFLMLGLAFTDESFLALGAIALILQCLAGVVMCFMNEYRTMGAGVLAGFGLFLLIGFSACTLMMNGLGGMH